jgi:predicted enzyme related to lactoylglutathione lyase
MEAHVSRMNILVEDMGKSLSFYKLLGFTFSEENYESGYVEERTPNGFRISWWKRSAMDGVVADKPATGYRVEIAVRCPGREGVDAVHQRIVDAGYTSVRPPFDSPWGQRYAFVEDPDGNLVGLEEHRTAE